jgi:TRAP-type C4-dicarboxylate transport system permease small subunit
MFATIGYMIACIILRYFFASSINYMSYIPNIFFIYVSFGAAYAYNRKAFINVDIIYRRFSVRTRAAIDLSTSLLFFLFVLALLRGAADYALPLLPKTKFDWGMLIDPARWPTTVLFPVGLILLLVSGAVHFTRNILTLITGKESA